MALELIKGICVSYDIDFNIIESNYSEIIRAAHNASRKMTTDRFVAEMKLINPNISILGDYIGSHKKIACKCNICGHEWQKEPVQLRTGVGCPICARKKAANNHHSTRLKNGTNTLATAFPEIAKEWDFEYNYPLTPNDVTPSTTYKAGWICSNCGRHFVSTINNRTRQDAGLYCFRCKRQISQSKPVVCVETKSVYSSVKEAKEKTGCKTISSCLTGKQKTAGGYHWEYLK